MSRSVSVNACSMGLTILFPRPPFVKHATISLCGLPKIEIAAIPLIQSALKLNAMNLPLIRTFISNSISTALYEYGTYISLE